MESDELNLAAVLPGSHTNCKQYLILSVDEKRCMITNGQVRPHTHAPAMLLTKPRLPRAVRLKSSICGLALS